MTDKKINEEQLDKVAGGKGENCARYQELKKTYNRSIDKYDTADHIGEAMLCWSDESRGWYLSTINSSYERSYNCGTERVADVTVIESGFSKCPPGSKITIRLDYCEIFIA